MYGRELKIILPARHQNGLIVRPVRFQHRALFVCGGGVEKGREFDFQMVLHTMVLGLDVDYQAGFQVLTCAE
jgi:hypothetical protein